MSTLTNTAIEIKNVTKKYHNQAGIHLVNVKFESGKLNLLVGKNGSGKTTLIKCIMGVVRYEGVINKQRSTIGYAPEDYVMPYFMSVWDFLNSIGKIKDSPSATLHSEIDEHLTYFEMQNHAHQSFGTLSNGMRQKVNLIQAFLNHPKTIILDEPLHGLDDISKVKILKLISQRMKESLIIVSTHYPELYKTRKKTLYVMEDGMLYERNSQTTI
ncbi:MAG: hypothetical protein CVV56_00250 [Tenericutes bacterium HGW-Tenericutes-1]|jgi:ABC-type multidrug transport system ATPase subunit|nr:MAG: hypothetical protein CVV56_00250 [Tenericutes bacterium HGW-Tenericutes-1]